MGPVLRKPIRLPKFCLRQPTIPGPPIRTAQTWPRQRDEPEVVTLEADAGGERLDKWLAAQLADRSRAEIQRWIDAGQVTRDGQAAQGELPGGAGRRDRGADPAD